MDPVLSLLFATMATALGYYVVAAAVLGLAVYGVYRLLTYRAPPVAEYGYTCTRCGSTAKQARERGCVFGPCPMVPDE